MRFPFNPRVLPWLSLLLGGLGLILRIWLLATGVDEKGLLDAGHIANILAFVLTAVFLLLLTTSSQPLTAADKYGKLFPASPDGRWVHFWVLWACCMAVCLCTGR